MPVPYGMVAPAGSGTPRPPRVPPMLSLTGGNGDTVSLVGYTDGLDVLSARGLLAPPVPALRVREGAGHGGRFDGHRVPPRTVDLRLRVEGRTGPQIRARLGRLADILDMTYGPATLTAATEAGSAGARTLGVLFNGGWGDEDTGGLSQSVPLTLLAPDPFFRAAVPVPDSVGVGSTKPFFGDPFFPVELAPSRAIGALTLVNPGDVAAHVRWTFTGPGSALTAQSVSGLGFTVGADLAAGEVRVVDTETKTLRDGDGTDRYEEFGAAPKLWTVPPGSTTAVVSMDGASSGSRIDVEFWPRFKLAA